MNISSSDRAVLLGSGVISVQIQRILKQRPGMTAGEDELRGYYMDLSEGRWRSTLISMKAHGVLSIQDGNVTLLKETKPQGEVSDMLWRAVLMKRQAFTLDDLAGICPGIPLPTIRRLVSLWRKAGAICQAGDGDGGVLAVVDGVHTKPHIATTRSLADRSTKGAVVKALWARLASYGDSEWTASMLIADLDVDISQWRYVAHCVSSWQKLGMIRAVGSDGDETTYRIDVDAFKEAL